MITIEAVRTEIVEAHVAIEQWFSGEGKPADLGTLLARFGEDFHMISTTGAMLDKAAVRALFTRLHATRPGCAITIRDVRLHRSWADAAFATYREDQCDAEGNATTRLSTVLLETNGGSPFLWRHLHETLVPSPQP